SEPLYQQAEERLFREHGVRIPEEDWPLFRGGSEQRFYELARTRYGVTASIAELRRRGRQYLFSVFDTSLDFMEGFLELQRQLVGRYRLGLVTSTPGTVYNRMAARLGLNGYFQEVIHGDMTAHSKPHPEPFLVMMHRLKVEPEQTVILEDSIYGLRAALAAGAWTVALTGSVPEEDMPPAHAVVSSLRSLSPEFFEGLELQARGAVPNLAATSGAP
ncbi:MAG: HAD family phosphatase, partial [Candidatus Neomarinimicrobiota bacterium]